MFLMRPPRPGLHRSILCLCAYTIYNVNAAEQRGATLSGLHFQAAEMVDMTDTQLARPLATPTAFHGLSCGTAAPFFQYLLLKPGYSLHSPSRPPVLAQRAVLHQSWRPTPSAAWSGCMGMGVQMRVVGVEDGLAPAPGCPCSRRPTLHHRLPYRQAHRGAPYSHSTSSHFTPAGFLDFPTPHHAHLAANAVQNVPAQPSHVASRALSPQDCGRGPQDDQGRPGLHVRGLNSPRPTSLCYRASPLTVAPIAASTAARQARSLQGEGQGRTWHRALHRGRLYVA